MTAPAACTVYYDGACPLCRREIGHYQRRAAAAGIRWVDASACDDGALGGDLSRTQALARLHVRAADGSLVSGAAAFAAIWTQVPGYGWLAAAASRRPVLRLLDALYAGFLRLRPLWRRTEESEPTPDSSGPAHADPLRHCAEAHRSSVAALAQGAQSPSAAPPATRQAALASGACGTRLAAVARAASTRPPQALAAASDGEAPVPPQSLALVPYRQDPAGPGRDGVLEPLPAVAAHRRAAPLSPLARLRVAAPTRLPAGLVSDLRTVYAIEVAAAQIQRGVLAMSCDGTLRALAARRLAAGLLRLQCLRRSLPAGARSRLLPLWRALGWWMGAVPALLGSKAAAVASAAVDRAVGRRHERLIAWLPSQPQLAELRAALDVCRGDGRGRRDASSPAGARPALPARARTARLDKGSRLAVAASRRW